MKTFSRSPMLALAAGLVAAACGTETTSLDDQAGVRTATHVRIDAGQDPDPLIENLIVCKQWVGASVLTDFDVTVSETNNPTTVAVDGVADGECLVVARFNASDPADLLRVVEDVPANATLVDIQVESVSGAPGTVNVATATWEFQGVADNTEGWVITFVNELVEQGGGEGCTPGFWKNHAGDDSFSRGNRNKPSAWPEGAPGPSTANPGDSFDAKFGVSSSFGGTLIQALIRGGGGENALGRHAVAALLNALSPDVDYDLTAAQVIALVQSAYPDDFEAVKDQLAVLNEQGCPL